jgi:succinyl-CoA synthetase beta subunit
LSGARGAAPAAAKGFHPIPCAPAQGGSLNLYEYQGRELYERFGIACAKGFVVSSMDQLKAHLPTAPYPAVVKAQVLVGGRGKAGGVKFAKNEAELRAHVKAILGMDIKGHIAKQVMVAEMLEFSEEYYCSFLIDRNARGHLMIFSQDGGMDIESVPEARLAKIRIDPLVGFTDEHAEAAFAKTTFDAATMKGVRDIMKKLYRMFTEMDAELVEVNPLAKTKDGTIVAADSKVTINDSALFRHPEFQQRDQSLTDLEQEARDAGVALIELDGNIGVIANGAGLTMATLDALTQFGGKPRTFLDLSGTDNPEKVAGAVRLMKKSKPGVMLLNLFGGITKCDTVAKGLVQVIEQEGVDFPIITRIKGTNEKEAKEILAKYGFTVANTLQDAAKMASEMAKSLPVAR